MSYLIYLSSHKLHIRISINMRENIFTLCNYRAKFRYIMLLLEWSIHQLWIYRNQLGQNLTHEPNLEQTKIQELLWKWQIDENLSIFTSTKAPRSSMMHMSIPTLLLIVKNNVSILYFPRPLNGFPQLIVMLSNLISELRIYITSQV